MLDRRFGMLVVIQYVGKDRNEKHLWECRCDCGKVSIKVQGQLVGGYTKSCGCLKSAGNRRTHGQRISNNGKQSKTYTAWTNMKSRCDNPNKPQWKDWGGRGITYDSRWADFDNFLADMGECPEGMSLERKNNDGNYCKANCEWATNFVQRRNARNVRLVEYEGKQYVLKDLAEKLGLNYMMIVNRIHRGWSVEEAIRVPRLRR